MITIINAQPNEFPKELGLKHRLTALTSFNQLLDAFKRFVKDADATGLAAALILRKDVCASSINETLGSGAEHNFVGKLLAQLPSVRADFKGELKDARKTHLPEAVKKELQRANRSIDSVLGRMDVRTGPELDEIGKKSERLKVICSEAKTEAARWAKGNAKLPRKKSDEEKLKEAGLLLRRACAKLESTGSYCAAVLPIVEKPIDQASQVIADKLAEHQAQCAKKADVAVTDPGYQPPEVHKPTDNDLDAA